MGKIDGWTEHNVTVRGREFRVRRIAWRDSDGLSYDVYDRPTGLLLTNESYDSQPEAGEISDLLDVLAEDLRSGTLGTDPVHGEIFQDKEATVREIVEAARA